MPSLENVINAGGPDPEKLTAAFQQASIGKGLAVYQRTTGAFGSNTPVFKLSTLTVPIPAVRPGAVAKVTAGASSVSGMAFLAKGTMSEAVPAAGLTVGTVNAAVRVIPKPGYIVRYAQFNPGGPADTGNYFNASSALGVFVTVSGNVVEIWVSLANGATAAITSTALLVKNALLASTEAMQYLQTVDLAGGTGASTAVQSTNAALAVFRPTIGASIAAGMSILPAASPGTFVTSLDGNLAWFVDGIVGATIDYNGAPMLLDNLYPGDPA